MRLFAAILVIFLLSSCGGRSSPPEAGTADNTSKTVNVVIDPSVPAPIKTRASKVVTTLGEFTTGEGVDIPFLESGEESLITAETPEGDMLMATLITSTSSSVSFSANSTALALCRMMISEIPENSSGEQLNSYIQNTVEYKDLVALIEAAHKNGESPLTFPGIFESISTVLLQVSQTDLVKKALSISRTSVTTPLPYVAYNNGLDLYSIWVVDANSSTNGVNIVNGIPIHYAAYGSNLDGSIIPTGNVSRDGIPQIDLPSHSPGRTALIFDEKVGIPGNGNAWNLHIVQTPVTRTANGIEVAQGLLKTAVTIGALKDLTPSCIQRIAIDVLGSTSVAPWASQLSASAGTAAFLKSLSSNGTWLEAKNVAIKCTEDIYDSLSPAEKRKALRIIGRLKDSAFAKKIAPSLTKLTDRIIGFGLRNGVPAILKARKIIINGYDIINFIIKASLWANHWDDNEVIGVCQAIDPVTNKLSISNCTSSLTLSPSTKTLLVGDNFTLSVVAKDSSGTPTLTPSNLKFSSSSETIVSVTPSGVITASKRSTSPITITVEEPITGLYETMTVDVQGVSAAIEVSPISLTLGGSATLSWSSINSSACSATGDWSGPVGIAGTRVLTPGTAGTFNYGISCVGPGGPVSSSIDITVSATPINPYTYDASRCKGPSSVTGVPGRQEIICFRSKDDLKHILFSYSKDASFHSILVYYPDVQENDRFLLNNYEYLLNVRRNSLGQPALIRKENRTSGFVGAYEIDGTSIFFGREYLVGSDVVKESRICGLNVAESTLSGNYTKRVNDIEMARIEISGSDCPNFRDVDSIHSLKLDLFPEIP